MKFDEAKIVALGFVKNGEEPTALGKRVWYLSPCKRFSIEWRLIYDDGTIDQIFGSSGGDVFYEIGEQYFADFEERMAGVIKDIADSAVPLN